MLCCSSTDVDSRIGDCASNIPFRGNTSSHVKRDEVIDSVAIYDYCCSTTTSTAAVIIRYRNGKLHVCMVRISSLQVEVLICPAALRPMSTAELVIAHSIDRFSGNTS